MLAVICEYNPLHNGHTYLTETAKRRVGEPVLAIMSGSFTQRGEVAVCSKFERTRAALQNGTDIVAELPTVYAVAAAQRFAQGGVNIAKAFSSVHYLAFGCETDDLQALQAAADAIYEAPVNARIAQHMQNGAYYPQAVAAAVRELCGGTVAEVLQSPNNILAVEYLRALRGSGIQPLPVRRTGAAHDSDTGSGGFLSASALRKMLRGGESIAPYAPYVPHAVTEPDLLERALLFRLRSMTAADFRALPEVGEGLENRLWAAVHEYNSVKEIIDAVKTKRYTHARLRRILCCAVLGITEDLQSRTASYARVLGFSGAGAALLKTCTCELITSPAEALRRQSPNADFLQKDILATDLAALAYPAPQPCGLDFRTKMIREN